MRSPIPWRLLLLAVLIISLGTQPVFLLGAGFLQIGDELGFSITGLGLLTGLFFVTAGITSPFLGKIVDRIGWQKAIRINAAATSVLLLAIAGLARSTLVLGLLLAAAAAVYGFANPAANLALAEHVHPRHRALGFGLKHAGIPSSTLLAGLAVPLLILSVGWRWAYVAAAALGIIVLALVPPGRTPAPQAKDQEDPRRRVAPLSIAKLIAFGGGFAMATWAAGALGLYLVAAAVDTGFSESAAGLLLFAGSAVSIASRVGMGHLTDRIGGKGFGGVVTLVGTGAVVFALISAASGPSFAVLVPLAFATGWAWPGLMTYTVVNANIDTVAASSSIAHAGIFFGAGAGPLILGRIADTWGFDAMWQVVAVALAASAIIVGLVGRSALAAE